MNPDLWCPIFRSQLYLTNFCKMLFTFSWRISFFFSSNVLMTCLFWAKSSFFAFSRLTLFSISVDKLFFVSTKSNKSWDTMSRHSASVRDSTDRFWVRDWAASESRRNTFCRVSRRVDIRSLCTFYVWTHTFFILCFLSKLVCFTNFIFGLHYSRDLKSGLFEGRISNGQALASFWPDFKWFLTKWLSFVLI